LSFRGE